ncbi:hypothetical protein [Candidatus Villigracilis affinis]|uniref:hypothetical protein n=1 Tax=Candidatus Villigracilis affinis TaxID=3140682 RepID=UPI001E08D30F|nr:hypothetical protein [Anaerolineales bacterium]
MFTTRNTFSDFLFSGKWRNTLLFVLLSALIIYHISLVKLAGPTKFDDAYMFIRYADNFLNGHGVAWNPDGVQTYGATSILYLALVVVARTVFQSMSSGGLLTLLSAGLGLLAILMIAYTCSWYAESKLLKNSFLWVAVILTAFFVIAPVYLFHMASGMDTTLSLLCNTLLIFATLGWVYNGGKYKLFLALTVSAGYLAFLARPDNLLYVFFFPLLAILLLAGDDKKQRIIHFFGWLFAILTFDTLIKFAIFRDPLPLPFYAKSSGYYEGYMGTGTWNPIEYLFEFGTFALPFLVVIIFSFTTKTAKLFAAFTAPVILTFAYYFTVIQIMGFEARYYFPAAPYLIVASFLMLDRQLASYSSEESPSNKLIRLAVILLFVSLLSKSTLKMIAGNTYKNMLVSSATRYSPSTQYITPAAKELPERGTWPMVLAVAKISKSLPQGTTFAQSEYGFVGAEAPNIQIIDIVGLHDPYFAHNGFSVDEFLKRKPDLIWFPHYDYTKIITEIIDSQEFWEQYDYYPGAFDFGLAIRKDSLNHQVIDETINKVWREIYETRKMKDYLATPIVSQ